MNNKVIICNLFDFLKNDEGYIEYLKEEKLIHYIEQEYEIDYEIDDKSIYQKIGRFLVSMIN